MSSWTMTARPTRATVEERGKAAIEENALTALRKRAFAQGEVLGPVSYEWWEDGTLRASATGEVFP